MKSKTIIIGIILILLFSSFFPITFCKEISSFNIIYVDDGDTDYAKIHYNIENGSLSGFVNGSFFNPIEGALVSINCGGLHMQNTSDSNGFYYIDNIPIIDCYWNVSASKNGYDISWVEMSIDINSTYDFILISSGKILYVGGNGPDNYSRIQDAIDNASNRDRVFVYNGSYFENIFINKTISLIGQNKNTTFIDGGGQYDCIYITSKADGVILSGFTIQHSGNHSGGGFFDQGIDVHSDNNIISNNIISNHKYNSIGLRCSNHNNISFNIIQNNGRAGIEAEDSRYNQIYHNVFRNNSEWGVMFHLGGINIGNQVIENSFIDNFKGIAFARQAGNVIIRNNFIKNNGGHARSDFTIFSRSSFYNNTWDANYWDDWNRDIPRRISGFFSFDVDWNPRENPYDFNGGVLNE